MLTQWTAFGVYCDGSGVYDTEASHKPRTTLDQHAKSGKEISGWQFNFDTYAKWSSEMLDDLSTQFHNQILVKFKKFRDLRHSGVMGNDELALALTDCAAALYHFREHFPKPHMLSRKAASLQCPDYKLIADVTNAIKHRNIDKLPPDGPSLVNSTEDVFELGVVINFSGRGEPYSHSEALVCVDCTDGKRRCLDDAVVNVVNYWGAKLKQLGLRDFLPFDQIPFPGSTLITREDARPLRLGLTQGLAYKTIWQLMEFDYDAGSARPIDLTGAAVNLRMYRPQRTLELAFKFPDVSEEYLHQIDLSDVQTQEFLRLTTDTERQVFQSRIADENRESIEKSLVFRT